MRRTQAGILVAFLGLLLLIAVVRPVEGLAPTVLGSPRLTGDTIRFLSDGTVLVARLLDLEVLDSGTGRSLGTFARRRSGDRLGAVGLHPDRRTLAIFPRLRTGRVEIWDAPTRTRIGAFSVPVDVWDPETDTPREVRFHPRQPLIAMGSRSGMRLWDWRRGKERPPFEKRSSVRGLAEFAFSWDGERLYFPLEGRGAGVWETLTGRLNGRIAETMTDVRVVVADPTGRFLAAVGRTHVSVFDAHTHEPVWRQSLERHDAGARRALFSDDGNHLYIAVSTDSSGCGRECEFLHNPVRVHDASTGDLLDEFANGRGPAQAFDVAPNQRFVAMIHGTSGVAVWDRAKGQEHSVRLDYGDEDEEIIAFQSNEGTVISKNYDAIRYWDVNTGELRRVLPTPTAYQRFSVAREAGVFVIFNYPYFEVRRLDSGEVLHTVYFTQIENYPIALTPTR